MITIVNNSHVFEITCKVAFLRFFKRFGTFSHIVQTWIVCHETSHTTLFGIDYSVEMVSIENNCHMLKITY